MAFKMKGSPMARNFGISPMKDATEPKKAKRKTPAEIDAYYKKKEKHKKYLEMRRDEFKKDSEGVYRDSEGKSVSQRYKVDKTQSVRDRKAAGQ